MHYITKNQSGEYELTELNGDIDYLRYKSEDLDDVLMVGVIRFGQVVYKDQIITEEIIERSLKMKKIYENLHKSRNDN